MTYLLDEIIEDQAERSPGNIFIIHKHGEISYGEFNLTCNRLANAMRESGIHKGGKSAVYMPNSPECLYALYGAAKAGIVTVPINFMLKQEELTYCLNKAEIEVVFTAHPYTEIVKAARKACPRLKYIVETSAELTPEVVPFSDFLDRGSSGLFRRVNNKEDDLALIQFTSGTTGKYPKGVMHTHKTLTIPAAAWVRYAGMTERDCCYNMTPLYHNAGLLHGNHATAVAGSRQFLSDKFSVSRFWDEVRSHGCTYFMALETILRLLMNQTPREDDADNPIRIIMASVPADLWDAFEKRFDCTIVQGYSSTEDTLLSVTPLDKELRRKKTKIANGNYIGTAMDPAMKQAVLDESGKEVGPGVMGELVRIGPSTMKGYYKDPEETENAFRSGWYHMGDLGYRDEEGHFYFVDRMKDIVRRGGENISSREVEGVLSQHPCVAQAAVIPVPDPVRMEEGLAFIVPAEGKVVRAEELWEFCERHLADFKIPRYIVLRDSLPLTGTNRVKKALLKSGREELLKGCPDRMVWMKGARGKGAEVVLSIVRKCSE